MKRPVLDSTDSESSSATEQLPEPPEPEPERPDGHRVVTVASLLMMVAVALLLEAVYSLDGRTKQQQSEMSRQIAEVSEDVRKAKVALEGTTQNLQTMSSAVAGLTQKVDDVDKGLPELARVKAIKEELRLVEDSVGTTRTSAQLLARETRALETTMGQRGVVPSLAGSLSNLRKLVEGLEAALGKEEQTRLATQLQQLRASIQGSSNPGDTGLNGAIAQAKVVLSDPSLADLQALLRSLAAPTAASPGLQTLLLCGPADGWRCNDNCLGACRSALACGHQVCTKPPSNTGGSDPAAVGQGVSPGSGGAGGSTSAGTSGPGATNSVGANAIP